MSVFWWFFVVMLTVAILSFVSIGVTVYIYRRVH